MDKKQKTVPEDDFRHLPLEEMKAIANRFVQRVNEAQRNHEPTKDMVRNAILRKGAERCPVRLNRLSLDLIIRYGDALADLFCEFPDDFIVIAPYEWYLGYQPAGKPNYTDPIKALMHDAEWTDEWQTKWSHAFGGVGATPAAVALKDWSELDEYLLKGIPEARAPGRLDKAAESLKIHHDRAYCTGAIILSLYERYHCIRGMENTFMDFYTNEKEMNRLLDALENYLLELIRYWSELGVDGVFLADDWGTQTSLMISLDMWRKFFKARYRRIFDHAHSLGMEVIFHSCGNVIDIVPDLIDVGLDVLDPIQPGAMDMNKIAREFGGKIAFCGAIDDQHLLTAGSPQKVKDEVRRTIDTLAKPFGNALIAAPANVLPPDIPLENLQALFEACHGL